MWFAIVFMGCVWAVGTFVALALVGANDDDAEVARYEAQRAEFERIFE